MTGRGIVAGAAWMVLFRLFDRSIGIVSTALLARLLLPADFGLVAMAMSVIAVIELATTFSFEIALIRAPDPTREHYDTAWTLNIIVGTCGAIATAAAALPAAAFYGDDRLIPVMVLAGTAWFIAGFENVGTVNFRREMNFAADFRLLAIKRIVGFVVTLAAALMLHSYWALVIGTTAARSAGVILSFAMHPFRPRLSLHRTRELFSFSGWLLISNVAGVVIGKAPHFIVGRFFGAQALGAYSVGAEIAHLTYTELVAPINRAMLPGYSRLIEDPEAFRRTCLDATAGILLLVMPVTVGLVVLAQPIVRVLLGTQWADAVPIIQILAIAGTVSAITSNNVQAYLALGRPHLTTWILAARLGLLAVAIGLLARPWGLRGVAAAELVSSLGSLFVSVPILTSTLHLGIMEYLRAAARPVLACIATGLVMVLVQSLLPQDSGLVAALIELAVVGVAGAVSYPMVVGLLWVASGRPKSIEPQIAGRTWRWLSSAVSRRAQA